jgi:alcohol dehydrogenase class IV
MFGRGVSKEVGVQAAKYGKKALIVTGGSSTKKSGLLDRTIRYLNESGIPSVIFDKVTQNPLTTTVYEGAEIARLHSCDVIIGLGGGSSLDVAKAIAFQVINGGDISEYIFGLKQSDKALPILLIPTTCGTGSEGNGFAVLTNPETGDKKSLRCNTIIAKCSLIDPDLMMTLPKGILASVGFDALCHNMEAYLSKISTPLSKALALEGIRLVSESLIPLYQDSHKDKGNYNLWEKITLASTIGGMVIHAAGVTAPHGMEHPISGLRDIIHGNGLAALTPVIIEESMDFAPYEYREISRILGGMDEYDLINNINRMIHNLELETSLSQMGVKEEDITWMAHNCIKVSTPSMKNHPKEFSLEDIKRIYRKAL